MAQCLQPASPLVRDRIGLHADQTSPQARKEPKHLAAPHPLPQDLYARPIDPTDLKDVLGQIQPNRCNLAY